MAFPLQVQAGSGPDERGDGNLSLYIKGFPAEMSQISYSDRLIHRGKILCNIIYLRRDAPDSAKAFICHLRLSKFARLEELFEPGMEV
jgi:hypothetical protein